MIKKIVLSLITVLSFCSLALAQNKQVTGTVTDEKGEPIIGATVVAEGTSAGTTTGGDGQFTLTVPANATLSISFIGYETQKVSVAGKTHIDVTLGEEATGIEDVVVIGYGTGKKIGSVIGSVDQVKSEKIENRPSTNVVDALQGQVAGLQIMTGNGELTSTSSIRIHGLGSMGADTGFDAADDQPERYRFGERPQGRFGDFDLRFACCQRCYLCADQNRSSQPGECRCDAYGTILHVECRSA